MESSDCGDIHLRIRNRLVIFAFDMGELDQHLRRVGVHGSKWLAYLTPLCLTTCLGIGASDANEAREEPFSHGADRIGGRFKTVDLRLARHDVEPKKVLDSHSIVCRESLPPKIKATGGVSVDLLGSPVLCWCAHHHNKWPAPAKLSRLVERNTGAIHIYLILHYT